MLHSLKIWITIILIASQVTTIISSDTPAENLRTSPNNYYLNPNSTDSEPEGSFNNPFHNLDEINRVKLNPGDSILIAAGTINRGTLVLKDVAGAEDQPIVISSYHSGNQLADKRAIIDAKGFANGVLLEDCSYIEVNNILIKANAGGIKTLDGKPPDKRCGILVQTTKPGNYGNITLSGLMVKDLFYEDPGFTRGKDEVNSANGTQKYGWGIRFINKTEGALLKDLKVMNCEINNIAHTGLKFTAKNHGIENIYVVNNRVIQTGGPGIQMSGVKNGMVDRNYVDSSGSNNDSRKWGRGSGLWTWGTSNVLIQNNYFLNANGPGDSAGCHIDFNCSDVVVQYNFSANNAGGFCEILGNNYNCAYRYNISVNDGYRVKGVNGAFQEGKIFWLSGFNGSGKKRDGPFNSYFYNNTIYVKKDIVAKIAVDRASSGVLIANNIFYIEGESRAVKGDQYKPETEGESCVEKIVFENNLYLEKENWPEEVLIQDNKPIFGDPDFQNKGGLNIKDYIPGNNQLVKNKGIEIRKLNDDLVGLKVGLQVKHDILGNNITGTPDMGAIELK
ncbi:MAG: right-handed parallel beta-helix repeat-containing protein [Bacteroidetes bacterium]|nr:right-handed parallel beta-helix repeat-containing protein [Bacteroidota bacterium]